MNEAKDDASQREVAKDKARGYIKEIAGDYREGIIRLGELLVECNKIYNGIEVKNADKVHELAQNGHEIVYVVPS